MNTKNFRYRSLRWFVPLLLTITIILSGCNNHSPFTTSSNDSSPSTKPDAVLIITPVKSDKNADEMDDSELIAMFDILYQNGVDAFNWPAGSGGIEHNENESITGADSETWDKVTNIATLMDLHTNYETVFSKKLLDNSVYPEFFEGKHNTFKEIDGELYIRRGLGVGIGVIPDFNNTKVTSKNPDSFSIETPMLEVGDVVAGTFTHTIVKQNGNWVLDSFVLFDQGDM